MSIGVEHAIRLLDGTERAGDHSTRAAAWIARSALEDSLRALIMLKGLDPGAANTRSLLVCIEVLYHRDDARLVSRAQYAWTSLSLVAHHHAYELAPTLSEVRALVDLVAVLADHVTAAQTRAAL